jgi:hypothetical protein
VRETVEERIRDWIEDPESNVEYAEEVQGRWAVRMTQETRDATTVWFTIGERSLEYEAYILGVGDNSPEVFRQALIRNAKGWCAFFALDGKGSLVLRGRLPTEQVTMDELDLALGEIWEMVELAFRPMVRTIQETREKSS